jgi:predicted ArsR family transcriptional regulator
MPFAYLALTVAMGPRFVKTPERPERFPEPGSRRQWPPRRGAIVGPVGPGDESSFDRLFATARALGEETRFGVYRTVCLSDGPVSVGSLAEEFSLHPNAIRQHLARLEQAGLIVSRPDRTGSGAGRPRRLYEPSPRQIDFAHPPRSTRALASVLAEAISVLPGDRRLLVEFGRGWGRTWAAKRKRGNGRSPRSRRGRADLLSRELRDWGWRPVTHTDNGSVWLTADRCLFDDLGPAVNGRACALEEGLLTGIAEAYLNGQAKQIEARDCRLEVEL